MFTAVVSLCTKSPQVVRAHPAGSALASDWSVNSFVMVVFSIMLCVKNSNGGNDSLQREEHSTFDGAGIIFIMVVFEKISFKIQPKFCKEILRKFLLKFSQTHSQV